MWRPALPIRVPAGIAAPIARPATDDPQIQLEQIVAIALGEVTGSGTCLGFEHLMKRLQHIGVFPYLFGDPKPVLPLVSVPVLPLDFFVASFEVRTSLICTGLAISACLSF